MADQRTLVLCKADAVARGLVGEIIARFERRGYVIDGIKFMRANETLAKQHYAEHDGKQFYDTLISDLLVGPVLAFVVSGENVVRAARQIVGLADPSKAEPGSIRADMAQTIRHNLAHASDSEQSARREIAIWFNDNELCPRESPVSEYITGD